MNLLSGKIRGTKNRIAKTYYKVKRLIEFIPTIWNTDDYDYSYTIDILLYQLERQAKYMEQYKFHTNWQYDVSRIRLAIKLLDLGVNEKYAERVDNRFTELYGESNFITTSEDNMVELHGLWWSNAKDSEANEKINEHYFAQMADAHLKSQKAYKLAWKIIDRHLQQWWV